MHVVEKKQEGVDGEKYNKLEESQLKLKFVVVPWTFVFITISKSDTFGASQDLLPLDQAQNVDWS